MTKYQPMFTVRITGLKKLRKSIDRVTDAINNSTTVQGEKMSELIDSVKEALENFSAAEANEDAQAAAAAALAAATIASLEAEIAELEAGGQANVEALIEVREALKALTPPPPPEPTPEEPPVDEG